MTPPKTLLLCAAIAVAGCQPAPFSQIGYFKDAAPNRVFILHAETQTDIAVVQTHAAALAHTTGQFTQAFYYLAPAAVPDDAVTLAADYLSAVNRMFDGPIAAWQVRAVIAPDGTMTLTDCRHTQPDDACKPS